MTQDWTYPQWWGEVRFELDSRYDEDLETYPWLPLQQWFEEGLAPDEAAVRAYRTIMGG